MIKGLNTLLENKKQPGLPELRALLLSLLDGPQVHGRFKNEEKLLRSRVYRLHFEINDESRSLVVKRFSPDRAYREQTAINRWLPSVGMQENCPPLIAIAPEKNGQCVWHVYEDLGDSTLDRHLDETRVVKAAVKTIANLHMRFARSPLLSECRASGGDLGAYFYTNNTGDALRSLENLTITNGVSSTGRQALIEHLKRYIYTMLEEQDQRVKALSESAGPETLLHGDLWTTNIFTSPAENGIHVRLIDWDHAGVGPVTYDLSTFLMRFPVQARTAILNDYQEHIQDFDWQIPSNSDLNLLFDTAERSRLANTITWLANAALEEPSDWVFDDLAEVDQWFHSLTPVLP